MSLKKDFIENLKYYKNENGLAQHELNELFDCVTSTIGCIESGKTFPFFDLIYRLAYALEIHPADLFLRNASQTREDMRKFFDEELSVKMKEMVEKKFPAVQKD